MLLRKDRASKLFGIRVLQGLRGTRADCQARVGLQGTTGILRTSGLHLTMGHYDRDCREHGGNEGLQGTMAAYGGGRPAPIRAVYEVYYNFCSWPACRARFQQTASAKSKIIVPRPRGSEPGSWPTRDYEGLCVTAKR